MESSLEIRMLGPLSIRREGVELVLPPSRKVRALLGYLALAPRPVGRGQLCELFWDVPDDPRGELRWCLSRLRKAVDDEGHRRISTPKDAVALDLTRDRVDAIEVARGVEAGVDTLAPARQRALCDAFAGDFLEGLEIERSPAFDGWLTAQRRRFRGCQVALLEHVVAQAPGADAYPYLDRWLGLAPFDRQAHERLLAALARDDRLHEAEEHLETAARLFETEGLDFAPIRAAWRAVRGPHARKPRDDTPPSVTIGRDATDAGVPDVSARRGSVAGMPFLDWSAAPGERGGVADALAHDVITRLAKLRSLRVIAQGTMFALHERRIGPAEAGRMLNVDYVVSGSVRRHGARLTIAFELAETRTARIVCADGFEHAAGDELLVLDEIGNRIVASIAAEIETVERNRAILKAPGSLDAWEAHHRGLWHMYLFRRRDNEQAQRYFEQAVRLDPTFARAHAGLSFTHFQNVFQGWAPREAEMERAYETAARSLMVDDRDPAAHWAMGRALWLRGQHAQSVVELEQAVDLSPNFALGHYTLAFVHSQAGDPLTAIEAADHSRHLSPFDPLLFGMLASRALALVRLGRYDEAAAWAVRAAARPNAHQHILAIAAFSLALAGSVDEARGYATAIRRVAPTYGIADFLEAFRYDPAGVATLRKGAQLVEM